MGSHILVETSRDPECPKVRWNDLFFRHVLFWPRPISLPLLSSSGVYTERSLSLSLAVELCWDSDLCRSEVTFKQSERFHVKSFTCRWQRWAPSSTGAPRWRLTCSGTTTCSLAYALTTWGAASTSSGRPSGPRQQPLAISRSLLWEMISTRWEEFPSAISDNSCYT